ncbi:MAG: helix-turn-helix domain-containing protein [Clostridia bacterium]|nr:helix-turn-helix domain-containing protein [Clostridia bacterium]
MDLSVTGKLIAEQRKLKSLTQVQLAEIIGVSEKTISKWECGKGFPDTSLILPLCNALDISANELLSGQILKEDEYKQKAEQNLINLKSQNQKYSKYIIFSEWIIGFIGFILLVGACAVAEFVINILAWKIVVFVVGILIMTSAVCFIMLIETKIGYHTCKHCNHKFVPKYTQVFFSMHMFRTRYLKCPNCGQRSWSKKTLKSD